MIVEKPHTSPSSSSSGGIGAIGVVQIVFIILKLLKVIEWSWWVVLIPLWIDLALIIGVIIYLACVFYNVHKNS